MDVLAEDQTLQAVLDRELGIDNEALDFHLGLEDYINGQDNILSDDTISAVAYSTGRLQTSDCALVDAKTGPSIADTHLTHHPQLSPHSHLQQQPHQHQMLSHPLSHHQQQHPSHQQQLQHHQQQIQQHQHPHHLPSPNMYCSQNRGAYDIRHNLNHTHTPLPDSPPDSGSEPYSPKDTPPQTYADNHLKPLSGGKPGIPYSGLIHCGPVPGDMGMGPKMPPAYIGGPEPPKLNHMQQGAQSGPLGQVVMPHQMSPPINHQFLPPHFGSLTNISNQPTKKRKFSDSPTNTMNASMVNGVLSIKQEPPAGMFTTEPPAVNQFTQYVGDCGGDDDFSYDLDSNGGFLEGSYQVIKWQPFNSSSWNTLTDANFKDLPTPSYRVDADKGFNYSVPDESFVCQKKNHFQVTVHIGLQGNPKYVRTPDGMKKIEDFCVHFHGIKMESPTQTIKIEQSQSDRSKRPFHPVKVDLVPDQVIKLTVGRLHYSETTSNNMRKKGKPNPDQRYFKLVVALHAHSGQQSYLLCAQASERIIVRASNPGQFDSEMDVLWQKGHTGESVYHIGRVGINTDHPEESLTIHGNMRLTGHLLQPSDIRAKENLEELNSRNQLENVQKLRIYRYEYSEDFAEHAGIPPEQRTDTGVIAQDILDVLPDAVQSTGDVRLPNGRTLENFLIVNKERIFMENVGAVKELCKLTDNLEVRIDELEKMNKRLSKLRRYDSTKSTNSTKSTSSISTLSSTSVPPKKPTSYRNTSSIGSSNNHHHHRHHSNKNISVWAMCSNRFIQITIIILILIMAFCLVAITTLYILERHKQTTEPSSPNYVATHQASLTTVHVPTRLPIDARTRSSIPPSKDENMNVTVSSTMLTTKQPQDKTVPGTTPKAELTSPQLPGYPPCEKGRCEEFCCPPPQGDFPVIHINGDRSHLPLPPHVTDNDSGGGDEEILRDSDNEIHPDVRTTTRPPNTVINRPGNIYSVVVSGSAGPAYHVEKLKDNRYRYKRQVSSSGSEEDIRLVVKELNFTIDSNFCDSCLGLNHSYEIRMSPMFGYNPVTIQFRMNRAHHVALCHVQPLSPCPSNENYQPPNNDGSKFGTTVEWQLPIGLHFWSNYVFRIADGQGLPDNNTPEICNLQSSSNVTVRTYSLNFERTCSLPSQD